MSLGASQKLPPLPLDPPNDVLKLPPSENEPELATKSPPLPADMAPPKLDTSPPNAPPPANALAPPSVPLTPLLGMPTVPALVMPPLGVPPSSTMMGGENTTPPLPTGGGPG